MNILIDMVHPADINFYKHSINQLSKNHNILITAMKRGNLPDKVKHEFPDSEVIILGEHKKGLVGKIMNIFARERLFFSLFRRRKFDVVTSFGFYPGMAARHFGIRSVHFHDDKEYRLNYFLTKTFCTRFVSMCERKSTKRTRAVNSYKELAYLHPRRFKEDTRILKELGVAKQRYIYIRDVAGISLNYKNKDEHDFDLLSKYILSKNLKVIFDSESGQKIKGTIPITRAVTSEEMNAIKNNAAVIITSGDTVLREGALLGVPTIYASDRNMKINSKLLNKGLFYQSTDAEKIKTTIGMMIDPKVRKALLEKANAEIKSCTDINKVIIEELTK